MKHNGIGNVYEVTEQALRSVAALADKDSRDIESIGIMTEMADLGISCLSRRVYEPPPTSLVAQALAEGGAWEWLEFIARKAIEKEGAKKKR